MSAFDWAIEFVLSQEGGLTKDDGGGVTKYGIAQVHHPTVNVKDLTIEEAKAIYREQYWEPLMGDSLPPVWGLILLDMAVNQGVRTAIKIVQKGLGVQSDGVIGAETLGALQRVDPSALSRVLTQRVLRYVGTKGFDKYGKGWVRRTFDVHRVALREIE